MSGERFVSEPIAPEAGSFDPAGIARGEPGLPKRFTWRGTAYEVQEVLTVWKSSTPEGGGGEMYLRRHWWEVRTACGAVMKLYCERQPKRSDPKTRWFLYTVTTGTGE